MPSGQQHTRCRSRKKTRNSHKAMSAFIIIISILLVLVAIAGSILPMLPGPPLAYAAILLLHFTDTATFSDASLAAGAIAVIAVTVLDYIIPAIGTKKFGGTKYGTWGCMIGTVVGMFASPIGIIVCPFLGAVIGELIAGSDTGKAVKAGLGAFLGFITGTVLKIAICIYFIIEMTAALL